MYDLLATTASLQLFAPLLATAGAALGLSVLGRVLAQRKCDSALARAGGLPQPLHASVTNGPLSVARVPSLEFERSVTLLLSEADKSLGAAKSAVISAADSAAMTLRMSREYLDDADLLEC